MLFHIDMLPGSKGGGKQSIYQVNDTQSLTAFLLIGDVSSNRKHMAFMQQNLLQWEI